MEDVNTRRRIILSLSKLGCDLQEFNPRKFHLHLAFKASWNNREDVWKNAKSFLIVPFSLLSSLQIETVAYFAVQSAYIHFIHISNIYICYIQSNLN